MNTSARHSEGRRSAARTHEAEKPGGAGNPRARATVDTRKQTAANTPAQTTNMRQRAAANTKASTKANTKARNVANAATVHKKVDSAAQADSANKADTTNKELRRMSRSELIEVIYALEQDNQSLQKENKKLRSELDDKDIRIATSGSIAEAALSLNHIFEDAQAAADQYLDSIKHKQVLASNNETTPVQTPAQAARGRHAL